MHINNYPLPSLYIIIIFIFIFNILTFDRHVRVTGLHDYIQLLHRNTLANLQQCTRTPTSIKDNPRVHLLHVQHLKKMQPKKRLQYS